MSKFYPKNCKACSKVYSGVSRSIYCSMSCSSKVNKTKFPKGLVPWNKGIKGKDSYAFGNTYALGNKLSAESKRKIGLNGFHYGMLGKKHSLETRKKMSEAHKGEKAPNWQGGRTALNWAIRGSYVYRDLVKKILKRDNYTCQNLSCGERGGVLHVNHKTPFAEIVRKNNITSLGQALACLELWDENNLETLCISCHKETPSYLNKHLKEELVTA